VFQHKQKPSTKSSFTPWWVYIEYSSSTPTIYASRPIYTTALARISAILRLVYGEWVLSNLLRYSRVARAYTYFLCPISSNVHSFVRTAGPNFLLRAFLCAGRKRNALRVVSTTSLFVYVCVLFPRCFSFGAHACLPREE
jgi:hypothetical protein